MKKNKSGFRKIALYLSLLLIINIFPYNAANVTAAQPLAADSKFRLYVESAGDNSSGSGLYSQNEIVTVYAGTTTSGLVFSHWVTSPSSVVSGFSDDNAATATFAMPAFNVTASAIFEPTPAPSESPSPSTSPSPSESPAPSASPSQVPTPTASPSSSPEPSESPSPSPTPVPTPVTPSFIAVSDITGITTESAVRSPLTLSGTLVPSDATNKTITWSIADAGTTQSILNGNTLTPNATGQVTLRASVAGGLINSGTFTKDFKINIVVSAYAQKFQLTLKAETGGRIVWGGGLYGAGENVSIFAEAIPNYRFDRWVNETGGGGFSGDLQIKTNFVMPSAPVTISARFIPSNTSALTGTIEDNKISPAKMKFNGASPTDIIIEMKKNQNFELRNIRNGANVLVRDEDYFVEGNTCIITAQYLASLSRGDKVLTFDMNAGVSPQLIVSVSP